MSTQYSQYKELETACTNGHVITHCCVGKTSHYGNGHVTYHENSHISGNPRWSPPPIIRYHHPVRTSPVMFTRTALVCSPAKSVVHNPIVVHAPSMYSPGSPIRYMHGSPIKPALHSPTKSALQSPKKSSLHSPSKSLHSPTKSARHSPIKGSPKGSPGRRGSGGMDWIRGLYLSAVFSWCQIRHRHRVKSVTFNKYIDTITYENVSG